MTLNKTKLVLGIATATLTMSAALVSPEALAHHSAKKHTHRAVRNPVGRSVNSGYSQVDALESQMRAMQAEIASLRAAQASAPAVAVDTAKIEELDQWMASVKAAPVIEKTKDNMMFFRGGYSHMNSPRGGTLDPTIVPGVGANANGVAVGSIAGKDAWYFGAGLDFSLNNNLFGFMDNTEVAAELMFDYKEIGKRGANGLSPQLVGVANTLQSPTTTKVAAVNNTVTGVAGAPGLVGNTITGTTNFNLPAANTATATVSQFTLAASPKIKFMKGSAFRPWIIPVGFEMNVISPPSNAITVLNPGMQFGAGIDYKIWKDLYVGADARYHQSLGKLDGINTNGVTAGGYLGIGF